MANSRRVEKLAALLKREVSELLVNGIRDERIHQAMITITSVEVSGDLQHARIFISLFGEEKKKDQVLVGLEEAKGLKFQVIYSMQEFLSVFLVKRKKRMKY